MRDAAVDWVYVLDRFDGRIGRQTFWLAMAVVGAANAIVCYAAQHVAGDQLNAILDLAFTYPEFAISTKRANDRDLPFWIVALFFAASVLLDLFSVLGWAGSADAPSPLAIAVSVPFAILGIGLLVELGFRKGTPGPNRHGPDPLANT